MEFESTNHIGIDYGSKMAGTTVVCYLNNNQLHVKQSQKKKDADAFIKSCIEEINPKMICIDAPLTLPLAYYGKGENFHFRKCDIETKAMSPMFLGGLTARAIALKSKFPQIKFIECYPAEFARTLMRDTLYNKKEKNPTKDLIEFIESNFNIVISNEITNYHQIDAILCWLSGKRYFEDKGTQFGDPQEGIIYV